MTPPIGHARVQALLQKAVVSGRVPQTLLFAGPEGVGKHTMAVALAQAVNCSKAQAGVACGTCRTCARTAAGTFSDVIEIDNGETASISIKAVRERVLDLVGYRPFEGQRRVFIIDPADALGLPAQDALLKTLEEPPPAAILILISAYADSLRPTIVSRCRRVRFGALTDAEVAQVLRDRHAMDAASARARAALAGGSVAQALALDGGVLDEDRGAALEMLQAAASAGVAGKLKVAAAVTKHGTKRREREALGMRLAHVSTLLRDLAALTSAGSAPALLANSEREGDLRSMARAFPPDRIVAAFSLVARAQHALDRNASPKIVADWVAVGL
jgi:DNA polymerase-3 subunit delta'